MWKLKLVDNYTMRSKTLALRTIHRTWIAAALLLVASAPVREGHARSTSSSPSVSSSSAAGQDLSALRLSPPALAECARKASKAKANFVSLYGALTDQGFLGDESKADIVLLCQVLDRSVDGNQVKVFGAYAMDCSGNGVPDTFGYNCSSTALFLESFVDPDATATTGASTGSN